MAVPFSSGTELRLWLSHSAAGQSFAYGCPIQQRDRASLMAVPLWSGTAWDNVSPTAAVPIQQRDNVSPMAVPGGSDTTN